MNNSAVILVSLNSKIVNINYINYIINKIDEGFNSINRISILLLDELERINLEILEELSEKEADKQTETLKNNIVQKINKKDFVEILTWDEFIQNHNVIDIYNELLKLYKNNKSFKRHCENQVFKNLHPYLVKKGIRNQRDKKVELLSEYLLKEISLKLYINSNNIFDYEISPTGEMDIMEAIYTNKYPFYSSLLNKISSNCIKVEITEDFPILSIKDLYFKYDNEESSKYVLEKINISIPSGIIYGIYGGNGSGKSTLIKLIGGHLSPNSGEILIGGKNFTKTNASNRPTNTVFQNESLFPNLTVLENITFGLIYGLKMDRNEAVNLAIEKLEKFNLVSLKKRYPSQLSGGQYQKISIIRSLLMDQKLLLLDEPTAAIDNNTKVDFIEIIDEYLNSKKTVIIVSHDINIVLSLCEKICILHDGRIIEERNTRDFLLDPSKIIIADQLNQGSIIMGKNSSDNMFTDLQNDIELPISFNPHNIVGVCGLLVGENDVIILNPKEYKPKSNIDIYIKLSVYIIRVHLSTNSYKIQVATKNGSLFYVYLSLYEHPSLVLEKNNKLDVGIITKNLKLLS